MSGTNTICMTTVLLETGMVPMRVPVTELTLESPAGLIHVRADCAQGKVKLGPARLVQRGSPTEPKRPTERSPLWETTVHLMETYG
jgi:hypothetical protein